MYQLNAPFSKSKTLKIKIRDLLTNVILADVKSELTDEYNPNKAGQIQLSTKTMPLTGGKYAHQKNGWHVCQDFYRSCCQGAGLKAYPKGTIGSIDLPNAGLTQANVQQLRAAFNDDDELLFAISTLANTCTAGAIFMGMSGALNTPAKPVRTFNNALLIPAITPNIAIKIKRGKNGRAEIDCIQAWSKNDMFGISNTEGQVFVKNLGVDLVTYRVHLVLNSSVNSITISNRHSWARAWFTKRIGSLFSSSASPDDMIEAIDDDSM